MVVTEGQHRSLNAILPSTSILNQTSSAYVSHSKPWSLLYDKKPELVLTPSTVKELQDVIHFLYESDLDFIVRGRGLGSASAADVVVSLKSFQQMTFDAATSLVEIEAGLDWGQVDDQLATLAPGHTVVGARCPYVGAVGSTIQGGLSWLSHELGLGSDPQNMIDAQVVLRDGRLVWASEERDLLWALRGGGGNFGAVLRLRLKAHKYYPTIFAGTIFYPASSLHAFSTALAKWNRTNHDPKTAVHAFIVDYTGGALGGASAVPNIVLMIFDANGEAHGRSAEGFKWAFEIPDAKEDGVHEMSLPEVHNLQAPSEASRGTACSYLNAALIPDFDEMTFVRGWDWWHETVAKGPGMRYGTFLLLEVMQKPAFNSAKREETAWPHGGKSRQHVLQLSVGSSADQNPFETTEELQKYCLERIAVAPGNVMNKEHSSGDFLPNFLLPNNDPSMVFAENYDKLKQIKKKYDPSERFWSGWKLPTK